MFCLLFYDRPTLWYWHPLFYFVNVFSFCFFTIAYGLTDMTSVKWCIPYEDRLHSLLGCTVWLLESGLDSSPRLHSSLDEWAWERGLQSGPRGYQHECPPRISHHTPRRVQARQVVIAMIAVKLTLFTSQFSRLQSLSFTPPPQPLPSSFTTSHSHSTKFLPRKCGRRNTEEPIS